MKVIIYPSNGVTSCCTPAQGKSPEQIAEKVVPAGVEYKIVDSENMPKEKVFSAAFTFSDPVTIDMDKARDITHSKRRAARAKEFKPWDDIIAKQIPGEDAVAAEAERQKIRDRYEQIQSDIDSAPGPAELKLIIDLLES